MEGIAIEAGKTPTAQPGMSSDAIGNVWCGRVRGREGAGLKVIELDPQAGFHEHDDVWVPRGQKTPLRKTYFFSSLTRRAGF